MIPLIERIAAGVNTEGAGGEFFFCVSHVVLGKQKGRRVMVAPGEGKKRIVGGDRKQQRRCIGNQDGGLEALLGVRA